MRAAYYEKLGPAEEVLRVGEIDTPEPGPGEVRVKVHVSGVNPSDWKARRRGRAGGMPFPKIIPPSDGAGVIDAVGEGVDRARLGTRVWVRNAPGKRPPSPAPASVCPPRN